MADYITLLGSDDVRRASNNMVEAADRMNHAAVAIQHTMEMHARAEDERQREHREWMDDWLERFKKIIDASDMPEPAPPEDFTGRVNPAEPPIIRGKDDDDIPF